MVTWRHTLHQPIKEAIAFLKQSHSALRHKTVPVPRTTSKWLIGNLSKDVFGWRKSTGGEASPLFICLDAITFVLLSVFTRDELPENVSKSLPKNTNPLPVDVRRSWTFLLKLSNIAPRHRAPFWLRSAQPSIREPVQKFLRPSTEEKGSKNTPTKRHLL